MLKILGAGPRGLATDQPREDPTVAKMQKEPQALVQAAPTLSTHLQLTIVEARF